MLNGSPITSLFWNRLRLYSIISDRDPRANKRDLLSPRKMENIQFQITFDQYDELSFSIGNEILFRAAGRCGLFLN